jgi:hypothetical protein
LDNSAAKPALVAADIPQPQPQRGEVLIRIGAAGVIHTPDLADVPETTSIVDRASPEFARVPADPEREPVQDGRKSSLPAQAM